MTTEASTVVGGVDTHKHTHYAAALDQHGRLLGHQEFPATDRGYHKLLAWMRGHGQISAIGVESTGSFGATLTRALTKAGERVVEVNRPNRQARRMDGKSDRLDAEQIARAVLGQTSTAIPKAKSGTVEVIRTLRVTRASAVKARTQAFNTLWGVMIGAPSPLRDQLVALTKRTLVNHCLRLRPETDNLLVLSPDPDRLLMAGVKTALRDLARRWKSLDEEIKTLNRQIEATPDYQPANLVRGLARLAMGDTKEAIEEPDEVEIFRKQLDPNGLYKIWPQKPLTPGEYAVVENTPGKLNMQIWDFTWELGARYVPDTRPDTSDGKKH